MKRSTELGFNSEVSRFIFLGVKVIKNKLAPCKNDSQLFTTDISASSKSRDAKTRINIKNLAGTNLDIVP